ncbi:MAG: sigma-70 family RNA polymerase sigma factor [Oleiphilaceae bacterium]|nr:sigma-70 family RNA polymerase sigma factor [Oleiphilaceae bacterium]
MKQFSAELNDPQQLSSAAIVDLSLASEASNDDARGALPDDDESLVVLAKQGCERAFEQLVRRYRPTVFRVAQAYVKDHDACEDIAQDVFLRVHRHLDAYRGHSLFSTWLYRIAVNTSLHYLAHVRSKRQLYQRYNTQLVIENAQCTPMSPDRILSGQQYFTLINRSLSGVSREQASALMLKEFGGMRYEEIAEVLACPVGTIRSRIARARSRIKAKFTQDGGCPDELLYPSAETCHDQALCTDVIGLHDG